MDNRVALFDMDGTLADYDKALKQAMLKMASPYDPPLEGNYYSMPEYLQARRHAITAQVGWWLKLERFQLGWDVLAAVKELDYRIVVLTKGPSSKPSAWGEKIQWCAEHLGDTIEGVTITHDKGLVYGKVLVDDWPSYVESWLEWRPRGLVIMPAHPHNENFRHPNVVRYDGSNLDEVKERLALRSR